MGNLLPQQQQAVGSILHNQISANVANAYADRFYNDNLGGANLAWEIDGFVSHGDQQAARLYLRTRLRPELDRLEEPYRGHLQRIADDIAEALLRWWVRP